MSEIKRLPIRQAEALTYAAHGPVGMVRGMKPQIEALKKRGYLDDSLAITDEGREAYTVLATPLTHAVAWKAMLPSWGRGVAATLPYGWTAGPASTDGRTVYVYRCGSKDALAVIVSTIPDANRPAYGLPFAADMAA